MLPRLVTPPAAEPLTLSEAKEHLRVEDAADDTYITTLIQAARLHVEAVCWRGVVTQTLEVKLSHFPGGELELPGGHLVSITSVTYLDDAGALQTLAPATYEADTAAEDDPFPGLGRLLLAYGKAWPSARCTWDAVRVRYVVGWAADKVPAPLRQAMLLLVSQMYEHRTPDVDRALSQVSFSVDALLAPYRLVRV